MERGGKARIRVVENLKKRNVQPFISDTITEGATVYTDDMTGYRFIPRAGYHHDMVVHATKGCVRGVVHTNNIEGFWSYLKRGIKGTHIWVSANHLRKYADEFAFRYNQRSEEISLFERLPHTLVRPVSTGQ